MFEGTDMIVLNIDSVPSNISYKPSKLKLIEFMQRIYAQKL
jgi:hypothetical protein